MYFFLKLSELGKLVGCGSSLALPVEDFVVEICVKTRNTSGTPRYIRISPQYIRTKMPLMKLDGTAAGEGFLMGHDRATFPWSFLVTGWYVGTP
jgi:hypothetical protein